LNEQLPIALPLWQSTVPVADRAQRIRDLVGVARTCIIEIGRELIAAKADVGHGAWLPWIEAEFGWSQDTAERYMQVARAFQIPHAAEFGGLTIDATALYALATPDVPQAVRDEAIERAEAGEHITRAEADEMVAKAKAAQEAEFLATAQRMIDEQLKKAIEDATAELADDNDALEAEIKRLKQSTRKPDLELLERNICRYLQSQSTDGTAQRDKLTDRQWQSLSELLNLRIVRGRKAYDPVSPAQQKINEERLRIASLITQALETLAAAPPVEAMKAVTWPVQRKQHARLIGDVRAWIDAYQEDLIREGDV
jgi:hypothetical protein